MDCEDLAQRCEELEQRIERLESAVINKSGSNPVRINLKGSEDPIAIVLKTACKVWDVTMEQIRSKSRLARLVNARRSISQLVYADYRLGTMAEIGDRMGRRDHSTIHYALRRAKSLLESNDVAFCGPHAITKAALDIHFKPANTNGHQDDPQI